MEKSEQQKWAEYRTSEIAAVTPILATLGYTLDHDQRHILGERYLMTGARDVGGGGYKLVLTGKDKGSTRVIIKVSSDPGGIREIEKERRARRTITNLRFSYHSFRAPREFLHMMRGRHLISVTEYIEQDKTFLERSNEEQFALALRTFKIQEGVHATTYAHAEAIRSVFGMVDAADYRASFDDFKKEVADAGNQPAVEVLEDAERFLKEETKTIEQYCGFLTHADFVPHNLRIRGDDIYLLDYASIHFGNKYESWGRFTNFMMLYNPVLEGALVQYVKDNRTPEESRSYRCMRAYKLAFLLSYHARSMRKSTGDAHQLAATRLSFWTGALRSMLNGTSLGQPVIDEYIKKRDALRSDEEKIRQQELH